MEFKRIGGYIVKGIFRAGTYIVRVYDGSLSLYREAAKEAEEIFDRWADEIDDLDEDFMEDEDYEPDEYYSN